MIASHSNFRFLVKKDILKLKESNKMKSVTVPDRTISLRQLIERHNSGGRVKSFDPVFLGNATVVPVGFERMDLIDRAQFAKDLPHFIADSRGRLQTMRDVRMKAEKEALAASKRAEYEALRKEFEAGTEASPVS